ncbi:MAG TPA: hypothetical protein VNK52_16120 [Hyphomicrobiaceae bacterium]|nr:hypothetical protein [Hyphomicrobiaceae bacterium]
MAKNVENAIQSYNVAVAITPSDATEYTPPLEGLMVGGTGNVAITDMAGNVVTLTAPAVGVVHRIRARKIMQTGTTATGIVGLRY